MSSKQIRQIFFFGHIITGVLIMVYIYSPTLQANPTYSALIQFVVAPFIVLSGIGMWQLPRFNKWRSQRRRMKTS